MYQGNSINGGTPQNGWFISWKMEFRWKIWGITMGYPHLWKPPYGYMGFYHGLPQYRGDMEWHPLLVWLQIDQWSQPLIYWFAAIFFPSAVEVDGMYCGLLPTVFMEISLYIYIHIWLYTYDYTWLYIRIYLFNFLKFWIHKILKQWRAFGTQPGLYLTEELATWEDLNPDGRTKGSEALHCGRLCYPRYGEL